MAPEAVRLEARALPDVKHRGPAHADLPREAPRRPGRERRARLAVWILCEFNPTGSNNGGDCSRLRSPPYEERADVGIPLPWILAWKACGEWVRGGSVGTRFGTRFSRQTLAPPQGNLGTDARFPSESQHVVVVR